MSRNSRDLDHFTRDMLHNALEIRYATKLMASLCTMVREGSLQAGDRIPTERELARRLRIPQSSVQTGIGYLVALGILRVRQGTGAFVAIEIDELISNEANTDVNFRDLGMDCIYEARAVLGGNLAALAAERCGGRSRARLAEELMELYVAADNPREYLVHEMAFHATVAQTVGNPILSTLMTSINIAIYDAHRDVGERDEELHHSLERHRKIFRAIRDHKPEEARKAMEEHLQIAQRTKRQDVSTETRGVLSDFETGRDAHGESDSN